MRLTAEKSLCEEHQKTVVSKDRGTSRRHCAHNPQQKYSVRHYKLDGELVRQRKCCDYLLTNDTLKKAYFIELKGGNIDEAVPQLEEGLKLVQSELAGYEFCFRVVSSKVRTLDLQKTAFRKFKDKWGSRLRYKTDFLEETL